MIVEKRSSLLCSLLTLFVILQGQVAVPSQASAAIRSDRLMSPNTRGFASIADINTLGKHWRQTQMGQLMQDESMRPFVKDLKRQLERKISGVRDKLGIEFADLKGVASGEIGVGIVERKGARAAVALTVDVAGNHAQLAALLQKVDQDLSQRQAKRATVDVKGTELTVYTIPVKVDGKLATSWAVYFVQDNILCATDNLDEAKLMLGRFANDQPALATVESYQVTSQRCEKESNGLAPEVHWYLDPFGYSNAVKSFGKANKKERGRDYVEILNTQGFDAIKGAGGFVNLAMNGTFELIHRTSVYAPAIPGVEEKYRLAMRMMKFPNGQNMDAPKWIPRKLASYRTFNMDIDNAFQHFGTLFDAIAGYEKAFERVLRGLEEDPYGPQVDVQRDFVAHLGDRVTMVTDYEVPITTKCERFLFAIELKNQVTIEKTVKKFMESDPNASSSSIAGRTVWEIHPEQDDIPELDINVSELDLLDAPAVPQAGDTALNNGASISASAVCVTDGHLFIASHLDFMKEILSNKAAQDTLGTAGDYREVDGALSRLLPGKSAARCFVRTDEAYRPVYELLRQGKMPESETLLGRLLNRLLAPSDDEGEAILREQKIDGRKLPEFEMVRRYFGPAGTIVRSEDDGWFITGATLTKLPMQARGGIGQREPQQVVR